MRSFTRWKRTLSSILVLSMLFTLCPVKSLAADVATRSVDNDVHYQVKGMLEAGVRYWNVDFDSIQDDGSIILRGSKFTNRSNQWGISNTEPYAGRFLLNFHEKEFYSQIQSVSIAVGQEKTFTEFDRDADGALWTVPILDKTWQSGLIGVVTNAKIRITLKDGQTIKKLGLEDRALSFNTLAVTGVGNPNGSSMIAENSMDQGFILANNSKSKNEMNTSFTTGFVGNKVLMDYSAITGQLVIKSIHSFKPNLHMTTSDLYWVVYIKEQMPKELLPYIDTANIRLGTTNESGRGNIAGSDFITDTPVTVDVDQNGLVDTSRVSAISIANNDTREAWAEARRRLDASVFGTLAGQNVNYTIQYPLKQGVSIADFARFIEQYLEMHDNQLLFESWMEADYPNEKDGYKPYLGKLDHGEPYKQLTNSYSNAYLLTEDSDKDRLWDYIELQIGSQIDNVDTDGDGVPDGMELLEDKTSPADPTDYAVDPPETDVSVLYVGIPNKVQGTVPRMIHVNPADISKELPIVNDKAGDVIVKLQGYDENTQQYKERSYGEVKIPFADLKAGNFTMQLDEQALLSMAGQKVVLVSYSPNGKNPEMGTPIPVEALDEVIPNDPTKNVVKPHGYATVSFAPGDGQWKDPNGITTYYVKPGVEIEADKFSAVKDNLTPPEHTQFSKWTDFPKDGVFTQDVELVAAYSDSRDIIAVTPKDPDKPFNPEDPKDPNNSQETPADFVRVIFKSGDHGTFGMSGQAAQVVKAFDVKNGILWEKLSVPMITAEVGYELKKAEDGWLPKLPSSADEVQAATYTAQYEKLEKVIMVDPQAPGAVPHGYATVTFDPGEGSWKNENQPIKCYVQKGVEITAGDYQSVTDNLTPPTNKKFSKWDGLPENHIFTSDMTLSAAYVEARDVIEVTPNDAAQAFHPEHLTDPNNSQTTPEGFVRIIFKSGEGGTFGKYAGDIDKVTVAYDVRNNQTWEKVTTPAVTAKVGYTAKSGADLWNPQLPKATEVITANTYTAQYTQLARVIPVDPKNPGTVPEGYVTVTFKPGAGSWTDDTQPSSYYVEKDVAVSTDEFLEVQNNLTAPADHAFSKWTGFPENGIFTANEDLTAEFVGTHEVIEVTPKDLAEPFNPENQEDTNNSQKTPAGFVRVVLESGEGGIFGKNTDGTDKVKISYDVKIGTLWEKVPEPTVSAKPGYTAKSGDELWKPTIADKDTVSAGTYVAQYTQLDKVIPVDTSNQGTVPDGYVTVTFNPGNGKWADTSKPSSYYVKKDVAITEADFQAVADNLTAPEDRLFSKWEGFPDDGKFTQDNQLTAAFVDAREIIEVTPKDQAQLFNPENQQDANNSQTTPVGYVRVIFKSGVGGTFGTYDDGTSQKVAVAYDVKTGTKWAEVKVPDVHETVGYMVKSDEDGWMPKLPEATEDVTEGVYTAQYEKLDKVIVKDGNAPETPPQGYVVVNFEVGEGTWKDDKIPSTYYVQENVPVTPGDFQAVADNAQAPENMHFSKWEGFPDDGIFDADKNLKATYVYDSECMEVTPKNPEQPFNPMDQEDSNNSQKTPNGFVRVIFYAGNGGTFGMYDNSQVEKTVAAYDLKDTLKWADIAAPEPLVRVGYVVKTGAERWDPQLPDTAATVTAGSYTAQYTQLEKVIPVNPHNPETAPNGYATVSFAPGKGSWKETNRPFTYYVQKNVEITAEDFRDVTDNLVPPGNSEFSEWTGMPNDGKFTADTNLTAAYSDTQNGADIVEVLPQDPTKPFVPGNPDDTNNSQKTPNGFVRVIFDVGEGGTFGKYNDGTAKVKIAYDVKVGTTWAQLLKPTVTLKLGYVIKEGKECWNPQVPDDTKNVEAGIYTVQYDRLKVIPIVPGQYDKVPEGYVTVTFDHGTGSWKDKGKSTSCLILKGVEITASDIGPYTDNLLAPANQKFDKWDGFPTNGIFADNVGLTAMYVSNGSGGSSSGGSSSGSSSGGSSSSSSSSTRFVLHYESNGGTQYKTEQYQRNAEVKLDKVPTRENYQFIGWYADKALTEKVTSMKMTADKTVYAGWSKTAVPDMLNGKDHFAYVVGSQDGTVRPLANISRAEVAAIFFRLLNTDIRDHNLTTSNTFADVNTGMWYNTAVSTMAKLGVVKGRSMEVFDPEAPITRGEFAAICARFNMGVTSGISHFSDISGHWAEVAIERAAALGWITGRPDGTFAPDDYITRAEAITMINRVLCRTPEDANDLLAGMHVWPDNQPGAWYYLAIQEATNSHEYERKGDNYEHWTKLIADPDWAQYQ